MAEPGPKKHNTASRQLRELQRLMAWSWDSRVEEHPPGEKAMHDFECVVNFQLDSRRRRTVTPSAAAVSPAPSAPACGSSPTVPNSGAKAARRGSGAKRPSPGPVSGEGKVGRQGSKASRANPSPADAAFSQQQQQMEASTPAEPAAAAADRTKQEVHPGAAEGSVPVDAPVPPAVTASPAAARQAAVEATPAVRQQQQSGAFERSPAFLGSTQTPAAALLAGVAQTPATAAAATTGPSTAGTTAAGAAALADGQCLPTPMLLPLSSVLHQQPSAIPQLPAEQGLEGAEGAAAECRQPATRGGLTLTSHKGKPEAAGAAEQQDQQQPAPALPNSAASAAFNTAMEPAVPAAEQAVPPPAADGAAPMEIDVAALAAVDGAATPAEQHPTTRLDGAALPFCLASATAAAPCAPSSAPPALPAAAAPAAAGVADVPTPVVAAFVAADQLMYHQPRPASCPPLFKQQAMRMSRAASKSPLGLKHRTPAAGKENGGPANSSSDAAALGFTPRTAEPAVPQPVALSAWKQQQLAALSAGFHSRQRRLLELLSACNRMQALTAGQLAAAGLAGSPAAPAAPSARANDSKPASGGKTARGRAVAAAAAAKPPLGPRAAAAGVGQVLGRLREQQAV